MARVRGHLVGPDAIESGKEALFVKELAYVAMEGLAGLKDNQILSCDDSAFKTAESGLCWLKGWTNTFIIHDPCESIPSLVHQLQRAHPDPSTYSLLHESGISGLHSMFHLVKDVLEQKPVVVDSGDLRKDPRGVLKAYCDVVGAEWKDQMMKWIKDEEIPQWETWSKRGWHDVAAKTTSFLSVKSTLDNQTIKEILDEPEVKDLVEKCLPVYEEMFACRLRVDA